MFHTSSLTQPQPPPTNTNDNLLCVPARRDRRGAEVKEVRTVARGFGAWGDIVIFLKDGSRLEMVGMENYEGIRSHIETCMAKLSGGSGSGSK